MKLAQVSLLVVLAFAAGIVCYRAAFDTPSPRVGFPTDVKMESPPPAKIVLANGGDAAAPLADDVSYEALAVHEPVALADEQVPLPADDAIVASGPEPRPGPVTESAELHAIDIGIPHAPPTFRAYVGFDDRTAAGGSEPEVGAPGAATAEDVSGSTVPEPQSGDILIPSVSSFDVTVADAQPETGDTGVAAPDQLELDVRIDAVPDDSRVRISSGDEETIEADELRLQSAAAPTTDDNPIPEFLRGGEPPTVEAGKKVVTIQVPVDNWVDLEYGDQVRVEFEQAFQGRAVNSNAGVQGNLRLPVCEGEIYALPQFAPETSDTVPVCLKLTTRAARELLVLRKNKGQYTLTAVKRREAQVYGEPTFDGSPTPDPVGSYSDAGVPSPTDQPHQPDQPVAEANPSYGNKPVPASTPYGAPESRPLPQPADDFKPEPRPAPESTPQPSATFDAPAEKPDTFDAPVALPEDTFDDPVARSETDEDFVPYRRPAPDRDDDTLPQIEPSEAGTVHRLTGKGQFVVTNGQPLILEAPLPIERVSGFDARLIRVTAETNRRLRIDGLVDSGETAMTVVLTKGVMAPFSVQIMVVQPDQLSPASELTAKRQDDALRAEQEEAQRRDEVARTLQELFPEADLKLAWIRDSILLRGTVASEEEFVQIMEIAEQYAPNVLNQLRVQPSDVPGPTPATSDTDATRSSQWRNRADIHTVILSFADPTFLRPLAVGDRIDVIRGRQVRRGDAVEFEEKLLAIDAEVVQVHVSDQGNLLGLRVSKYDGDVLSDTDTSTLRIVPHGADTFPPPDHRIKRWQMKSDRAAEAQPPQTKSIALSRECIVAIDAVGKLDLRGCAKCHADHTRLDLKFESSPDSLSSDIRALHDDVRKLIALLEQRNENHTHPDAREHVPSDPAAEKPSPPNTFAPSDDVPPAGESAAEEAAAPADADPAAPEPKGDESLSGTELEPVWREFIDNWGRAMLKREFRTALDIVHEHRRTDPGHDFYDRFAADSQAALTAGSSTKPLLVAVLAEWCGPCRHMAPLIRRLQDRALDVVVVDADQDADLMKSLEVTAVPTLAWVVDGRKQFDSTGITTEASLNEFHKRGTRDLIQKPDDDFIDPTPRRRSLPDDEDASPRDDAAFREQLWNSVGLRVVAIRHDAPQLRGQPYHGGLLIKEVRPDSPTSRAGFRKGDVLVGLQIWEIVSPENVRYVLDHPDSRSGQPIKFYLLRNRETLYGQMLIDWPAPADGAFNAALPAAMVMQRDFGSIGLLLHDTPDYSGMPFAGAPTSGAISSGLRKRGMTAVLDFWKTIDTLLPPAGPSQPGTFGTQPIRFDLYPSWGSPPRVHWDEPPAY